MARGRPRKKQGDVLVRSAEMIGWAIGGIEREIMSTRERLTALTAQANTLRSKLPGGSARGASSASSAGAEGGGAPQGKAKRRRRKMSPEARKRISEMMKKRWAERRKTKAAK